MVRNIDTFLFLTCKYTGSWCAQGFLGNTRGYMREYDKKKPICAIYAHMGQANYDLELIIGCAEGMTGCAE